MRKSSANYDVCYQVRDRRAEGMKLMTDRPGDKVLGMAPKHMVTMMTTIYWGLPICQTDITYTSHCADFTNEETEAQRGYRNCLSSAARKWQSWI